MKVTHVEDHVTHAVISGAQAIDFGISDSPEFFNILSSTLYTDQKLAVIRETLCNLWDAHIEFGCENVFGDITLDDKMLVIRDYGPGIAPHMIGPVYGTYGGSTKQANGQVTGGFGLGCKAPFAYVDDFEVTSYHDGKMTVYRLSKSNAEVGGKPSIIPVVSGVPTKEHGLQIKIAVKNSDDRARFRELIERIVQNGAMKIKLNGVELPTMPFDDMVNGYMLTCKKIQENFSAVNIRYGNVIYPIEREQTYGVQWDAIIKFLERMQYNGGYDGYSRTKRWALVLQAAPNTVSVTPSRESLSNQKHTLATITELMDNFLSIQRRELQVECFKLLEDSIEKTMLESTPSVLFDMQEAIPNLTNRVYGDYDRPTNSSARAAIAETDCLTSTPQFVRQYAYAAYPSFAGFDRKDRITRINSLIRSGFGGVRGRKLLKTYRREFEAERHRPERRKKSKERYVTGEKIHSPWFHREVVAPLMRGMNKDNGLKPDKLWVYPAINHYRMDREKLIPAKTFKPKSIEKMWPFVRNIVILSYNKMDVTDDDANRIPIMKFWLGKSEDSLVYIVPRAADKVKAAHDYFTKMGAHVVDLTPNQQRRYEEKQEEVKSSPIPKKPKRNGIPLLSACVTTTGAYTNNSSDTDEAPLERTTTPVFIYKDGRRNEFNNFDKLDITTTRYIIELFGASGGVVANQNQYDRYKNAGAVDWEDYILNKLVEQYTTNPRIREYLPFDYHRVNTTSWSSGYRGLDSWLRVIKADRDLFEYFGLVDNRTNEDKKLMKVFRAFASNYLRGSKQQFSELEKILKDLPVSQVLKGLFDKLKHSRMLQLLEVGGATSLFVHHENNLVTETQRNRIRDILLFAIEG